MTRKHPQEGPQEGTRTVASAYLSLLSDRGVGYLFGNAGTDFAPIVEAYADAMQSGTPVPRPILAAHENLAVSMAHGYAMLSREVAAVMVHVSVGTANMICAAMNAARENVALLLTAGRSPITEKGMTGSRDGYIHWSQELYDQAAMIRELVKWDYELRNGEQLETVIDRALAIAQSEPRGPVYLSLPREVIGAPVPARAPAPRRLHATKPPGPDPGAIATAATMLAAAAMPIVFTSNAGRDPAAFEALATFADRFAIPVVQHKPRYLSLPSSHAMNLGYEPARLVGEADVALVIESDVPWIPVHGEPKPDCKVIQCGLDPLFTGIPIRGFACDLGMTVSPATALAALADALAGRVDDGTVARRRERIATLRQGLMEVRARVRDAASRSWPISMAWVSHCLQEAKDTSTIVVNEYTLDLDYCGFEGADLYFGSSSASGLGWGAGAALGAKIAGPGRTVVAVMGDGAFMFSNPAAVHHAAAMHELPVLFVVTNNSRWNAVRRSTLAMYPDGRASRSNDAPFMELAKLPAFERICESAGGYGERVEAAAELPAAFQRAMAVVRDERRQALLNVICG
jgi:acetolactate synthase I/II/III large subunit